MSAGRTLTLRTVAGAEHTLPADALRTASTDPHGAGESVTGWRVIASS